MKPPWYPIILLDLSHTTPPPALFALTSLPALLSIRFPSRYQPLQRQRRNSVERWATSKGNDLIDNSTGDSKGLKVTGKVEH